MNVDSPEGTVRPSPSLQDFLDQTPWWVARRCGSSVTWDGQSAFIEQVTPSASDDSPTRKPTRRIRSLKKKDLYAAWNGMMRTPRFVRRKLRRTSSRSSTPGIDSAPASHSHSSGEESIGETIVWRRFIDQLSDISYRADSKRLGDDHLHDLFGEFRHYIVEKYAYNMANRFSASEPTDVRYDRQRLRFELKIVDAGNSQTFCSLWFFSGLPVCLPKGFQTTENRKCLARSCCQSCCSPFRRSHTVVAAKRSRHDANIESASLLLTWRAWSKIPVSRRCCQSSGLAVWCATDE